MFETLQSPESAGAIAVVYALIELVKWVLNSNNRNKDTEFHQAKMGVLIEKINQLDKKVEHTRTEDRIIWESLKDITVSLDRMSQTQERLIVLMDRMIDKIEK